MPAIQSFDDYLRIPENNDWAVLLILLCLFLYIFLFNVIERGANLKDFLLQKFYDANNNLPSWIIVSIVMVISLSTLISQYIPVVPAFIADLNIAGYQLNKIGFTIAAFTAFYIVRTSLSFLLYQSVGDGKRWAIFYFTSTKLHFIYTAIIMMLCIMHYYFPIEKNTAFIYYLGFFGTLFIFKIFFYLFHKNKVLPEKWYYKFLYICTLQIAPLVLLWKVLFF